MKIQNLRSEKKGDRVRVAATVTWEDCDRPTHEVYFETGEAFSEGLSCNPHAFLVGCTIPAMHYGEERVFIDAEICPELRDNLTTAMSWLRHWFYGPERELVRIEAKTRSGLPTPRTPERAGFFFSGGIDSFATLRANRLGFPLEHPWSIKDGLVSYGLELDDPEAFTHLVDLLSRAAHEIGITLVPVYTNVYLHYRDEDAGNKWDFWTYRFMGAALAAIAHAFARRFTVVSIASSYDIPNLHPHSLNPALNYSSSDLRIRHDGIALSRLAKTRLVAEWDVALRHLRVCNQFRLYQHGQMNCGRCEKCLRTMLALLALGVLEQTTAFPQQDVSAELVREAVRIKNSHTASWYRDVLAPLTENGRHDLVSAIEHKLAAWHKQQAHGWKTLLRQFDGKYLDGRMKRLTSHLGRAKSAAG